MENYLKTNYQILRSALWDDIIDRSLFFGTAVLFFIAYIIWSLDLKSPDIFIYLRVNIYPVKLLAIILTVNSFLAIVSHDKEKEIGYFLFISNILLCVLAIILEIFYISNL